MLNILSCPYYPILEYLVHIIVEVVSSVGSNIQQMAKMMLISHIHVNKLQQQKGMLDKVLELL